MIVLSKFGYRNNKEKKNCVAVRVFCIDHSLVEIWKQKFVLCIGLHYSTVVTIADWLLGRNIANNEYLDTQMIFTEKVFFIVVAVSLLLLFYSSFHSQFSITFFSIFVTYTCSHNNIVFEIPYRFI